MLQIFRVQQNFHFFTVKKYTWEFIESLYYIKNTLYTIKKSNSTEDRWSPYSLKIKNKLAALSALQWSNHLIIPNNKLLNATMYYLKMLDPE